MISVIDLEIMRRRIQDELNAADPENEYVVGDIEEIDATD